MTLVGFHVALGFLNLICFAAMIFTMPPSAFWGTWNGIFAVINFTYAGYLLSKAL